MASWREDRAFAMEPAPSDKPCSAYQLGTRVKRAVSAEEIWKEIVRDVSGVLARFASVRRASYSYAVIPPFPPGQVRLFPGH